MPKHAWRATRAQSALLGNLRPSSDIANRAILFDSIHLARMAQPAIGFCHSVPASAHGDAPLLILATMIQMKGYDPKIPYSQAQTQCVRQKLAGRVWNQYMDQGMKSIGFTPSKFDHCLYYPKSITFLVYIDDCIVFIPNNKDIDEVVSDWRNSTQNFALDEQGEVGDFLGIQIQTRNNRSIVLTQPHLIDSIIQDLHLQSGSNPKSTPSITTELLHKDAEGQT